MKISKQNLVQMKITKLIKIFKNCEMALKRIPLEIQIVRIKTEMVVEKKIIKILKSYKFLFELVKSASNCLFLMLFLVLKHFSNTVGPQIVLFLRSQGTVLLKKPYYSGTDLVLRS